MPLGLAMGRCSAGLAYVVDSLRPFSGACREVLFFCGTIAPTLRKSGVATTLSAPPQAFLEVGHFNISDYLVNVYFLLKFLRVPVKVREIYMVR